MAGKMRAVLPSLACFFGGVVSTLHTESACFSRAGIAVFSSLHPFHQVRRAKNSAISILEKRVSHLTYKHTYICIHTYIHTYMYTHIHTCTLHTYIHTFIHTYRYTYTSAISTLESRFEHQGTAVPQPVLSVLSVQLLLLQLFLLLSFCQAFCQALLQLCVCEHLLLRAQLLLLQGYHLYLLFLLLRLLLLELELPPAFVSVRDV